MVALELFAAIGRPLAEHIQCVVEDLKGAMLVVPPPDSAFDGTPTTVMGRCDGPGEGKLVVTWNSNAGRLEIPRAVSDAPVGEDLRLLQGARIITDYESEMALDGSRPTRRQEKRARAHLEKLSLAYGLASRAAALVAVVNREGDVEGEPPSTHVVPVGMPQDVEFGSYFATAALAAPAPSKAGTGIASFVSDCAVEFNGNLSADPPRKTAKPRQSRENREQDILVQLAGGICSDGGMPGKNLSRRALNSALTLLAFAQHGHQNAGPFAPRVRRLTNFVRLAITNDELPGELRTLLRMALGHAVETKPFKQNWTGMAQSCVLLNRTEAPAVLILLATNISSEQGTPVRIMPRDNRTQA